MDESQVIGYLVFFVFLGMMTFVLLMAAVVLFVLGYWTVNTASKINRRLDDS